MEKIIKISARNREKLELFIVTLKEVAKDMEVHVKPLLKDK
tara:strand:- start:3097 stop:3219 length:123 start_codon:yes stop_codon:yes gene_type:complete